MAQVTTTLVAPSQVHAAFPTISWTSPSNNATVAGQVILQATATGTSSVVKWCLKQDGAIASTGFTYTFYTMSSNYTQPNFDNATGCWTTSSSIGSGYFTYDTTAWPNGSHTYQLTVTDTFNQTTTSSVLTVNNSNANPTVAWTSPSNNSTESGSVTLSASAQAASSGTARVVKWCLKKDNAIASTGFTYTFYTMSSNYTQPNFDNATGCWTTSSSIGSGYFTYDTTAWPNGSHTYELTVTDTSGRSATSSVLTVNNSNANPTVAWTSPSNNSTESGSVTLRAQASAASSGTAQVVKWCLKQDGAIVSTGFTYTFYTMSSNYIQPNFENATGCWTTSSSIGSGYFTYDTTRLLNGKHSFVVTTTDNSGRSSNATLTIETQNNTKMEKPTYESPTLYWPDTKPNVSIYTTTSSAKTFKIQYGTTKSMKSKKTGSISANQTLSVGLKNLKPNTMYYFRVSVTGINGTVTSEVKKVRTSKRPSPPPSTTTPPSRGNSGGSYYPLLPIVPVNHGVVVSVYCDLRTSGLSSNWYGQSYYWTFWKVYQDGYKQSAGMGSGYYPPAACF